MAEPATTSATVTMVAATATVPSLIAFGVPSFTGDGTSGIFVWGAQLQALTS